MPTLSLRWIIGLLAAFVIAAGVHLYLTRTYGSRGGPEALRMDVTDFMAAARAGELTEGRIAFRTNATGLADLTARRTLPGSTATATTQTTARLTDGDLALLRERRFAETDAAALAWVVNLGCVDLNPQPVRAEDLRFSEEGVKQCLR